MITMPSYATTMCAANDTVAIILDPSIERTEFGRDSLTLTWWAVFPYGRIQGSYACVNENETAHGFEKYGRFCWCKMTNPLSSNFLYCDWYKSTDNCNSYCAGCCSSNIFRENMFGSIPN